MGWKGGRGTRDETTAAMLVRESRATLPKGWPCGMREAGGCATYLGLSHRVTRHYLEGQSDASEVSG